MTVPVLPCGISVPRYLCRSASGRFWILLEAVDASPGDLVLCRRASGLVVRRYTGQACLGVLRFAPVAGRAGSRLAFSSRDGSDTVPGAARTS